MRVLVTGATSMIGAAVVDRLLARGDDVTVMQRRSSERADVREVLGDLVDPAAVADACVDAQAVVHLAAKVGVAGRWDAFEAANIGGLQHLLAAAKNADVERFVHVSTPSVAHHGSAIVGAGADAPAPDQVRGHYARSKAIGEELAIAASSPTFPVVALRPHLVFGPGDTQLVGRIVDRARSGRLALVGSGLALIDTTYVDNAADAMVAAIDRADHAEGRALVVSNGQPRTVIEVLQRILQAFDLPTTIRSVPTTVAVGAGAIIEAAWDRADRSDDPPMTRFLAEQLSTAHWFEQQTTQSLLDWTPAVDLADGFARLGAGSS